MKPFILSSYRPPEILRAIASDPRRGPYLTTSNRAVMIENNDREKAIISYPGHNDVTVEF